MIYEFESPNILNSNISAVIGQTLKNKSGKIFISSGSSLYNLRKLTSERFQINENARCNFEKFEKGILLRINDRQNYYCIPLTIENVKCVEIRKGDELIWPFSFTALLSILGFTRANLKKYWIFSRGFYHERFELYLNTKLETLLLEANPSCYKAEKKYFTESAISQKFKIKSYQNSI